MRLIEILPHPGQGSKVHPALTIIARLEDAGRTIAMLPIPANARPAPPGCAWPDVLQSFWDVVGHADVGSVADRQKLLALARLQPRLMADHAAVDRLDEVLGWLWSIKKPHCRKAVSARMLVHPVTLRHLKSWSELSREYHVSRKTVQRWYDAGVRTIINSLAGNHA